MEATRHKLEELEHQRLGESERSQAAHRQQQLDVEQMDEMEAEAGELRTTVQSIEAECRVIDEENKEQIKLRATLELDIADLQVLVAWAISTIAATIAATAVTAATTTVISV